MGINDDASFLIADEISMYEQQSAGNPHMPLRLLRYTGSICEKPAALRSRSKSGKVLIDLSIPQPVVFRNGREAQPETAVKHFSDAFPGSRQVRVRAQRRGRLGNPAMPCAANPIFGPTAAPDNYRFDIKTH